MKASVKYKVIYRHKDSYSISEMCRFFEVSRSGYYDFVNRLDTPAKDLPLDQMIQQCQEQCRNTYGYRRVHIWLERQGVHKNPKTVLRIMRKYNLLAVIRCRKYKHYRDTLHRYPNLLNRNFHADRPNQKWVTDISYIKTLQGTLYLSIIRDLYDNSIVAYQTGTGQNKRIISMYAKGMTTRQISETIEDIYGFETSESFISDVIDKILPQIEDWQNRPLDEVYPILYIDAIHYSVRDNGVIRKLAAYVILGINTEGKKEVLTISVGDNESAKYWLSVMNELKNRGVKDVLIICADGLTGIKEAIAAAFPKTEYQRCIVHQVRNTLKYVPDKDRKAFATDLKTIYQAADEKKALAALDHVTEKWTPKYPNSMKRWKSNWDAISPIFKFSATVRKVIYTTNAIESLNSTYRKLNRQRSVFPSDTALLKALYLATFEATKKWTSTIRNWAQVYGELSIMYEGRLPE